MYFQEKIFKNEVIKEKTNWSVVNLYFSGINLKNKRNAKHVLLIKWTKMEEKKHNLVTAWGERRAIRTL